MPTEFSAVAPRTVGRADAITEDFVVPYYLEDRKLRISVARVADRLYAFDDLCTCADRACPLSGGLLTETTIMCQCHGSRFDIATGAVINGPLIGSRGFRRPVRLWSRIELTRSRSRPRRSSVATRISSPRKCMPRTLTA